MNNWKIRTSLLAAVLCGAACGGDGGGDGGGGGECATVEAQADVTAATTWGRSDARCTVDVKRLVKVPAALTIAPGTTVRFAPDTGIEVRETGSIKAVGTTNARITFTGAQQSPGYWKGLAFRSNDPANQLAFVDVRYAGGTESFCCDYFLGGFTVRAAIVVQSSARLELRDSRVTHSGQYGLFAFPESRLQPLARNTFEANTLAPLAVPLTLAGVMDPASDHSGDAAANAQAFVALYDGNDDVSGRETRLRKLDVPYRLYDSFLGTSSPRAGIEVEGNVVVEPGTRVEVEPNVGLQIMETGSFKAMGTSTARITLAGREATPGYWKGLAFRSYTTNNHLSYVDVLHAGGNNTFCCDYFEGGLDVRAALVVGANARSAAFTMENSKVAQSGNYGVYRFSTANFIDNGLNTYEGNASGNRL